MEFLGTILAIGLIIGGIVTFFTDAREKGIGFVILECLAVFVLVGACGI